MLRRRSALLTGPPPALPPALDHIVERWAAAPPRVRLSVGAVAIGLVLAVAGRGAATSPWGEPVGVLVATADLPAGRVVGVGDLRAVTWPSAVAPPTARLDAHDVVGAVLAVGLPEGALLTPSHLAADGVAADLSADRVAYPLPISDGTILAAGQVVDLVTGDGSGGGLRLASAARVLAVDGATAWVAVRRDEAPALAGAAAWGEVVAVVLPSGDQSDGEPGDTATRSNSRHADATATPNPIPPTTSPGM